MSPESPNPPNPLVRLWTWAKSQWVQEVPVAEELCEFDCRKQQCMEGEWASCERRLTFVQARLGSKPGNGSTPAGC